MESLSRIQAWLASPVPHFQDLGIPMASDPIKMKQEMDEDSQSSYKYSQI